MRAVKLVTLLVVPFALVTLVMVVADMSHHDATVAGWSFVCGVLVVLVVPRLWRWADRS